MKTTYLAMLNSLADWKKILFTVAVRPLTSPSYHRHRRHGGGAATLSNKCLVIAARIGNVFVYGAISYGWHPGLGRVGLRLAGILFPPAIPAVLRSNSHPGTDRSGGLRDPRG